MNLITKNTFWYAVIAAITGLVVLLSTFVVLEPTISRAQITDEFLVTQNITAELAFVASTTDVAMDSGIASLTGGTSNGTTTVAINTNNSAGYNLTLGFSSSTAMNQDGGTGFINNYAPASAGTPDYNFDATELFGQFAYRVTADQVADLDASFEDNGSNACGSGGGNNTYDACWLNGSTTAKTIIDRSSATSGGSTTTLNFRVSVPANPSPTIPTGSYTATATLTATLN